MDGKPLYDHNLFKPLGRTLYYGNYKATTDQIKFYNAYFGDEGVYDPNRARTHVNAKGYYTPSKNTRNSSTYSIDNKTKRFFPKNTNFTDYRNFKSTTSKNPMGNRGWAAPLGIKKQVELNPANQRYYRNIEGKISQDSSKYRESTRNGRVTRLKGSEFIRHLQITRHALEIGVFNFKIAVGKRAVKVFQDSFRLQRFNSAGESKWADLAEFTQHKREKRGTYPKHNPVLREYMDLRNSIEDKEYRNHYRVTTKTIQKNEAHHKKFTGCWAYFHNEGVGTYGKGFGNNKPKPYIKRQFMGHSTLLDFNADKFMEKMTKRYLFDSVFLVK